MKNAITVNMIVKDESASDFADILVVMDTGSTDDTISKIEKFCDRVKMTLYLTHGTFLNFEQARNDALMFAESWDNVNGYILILDANDELREGAYLRQLIKDEKLQNEGYYINQDWQNGNEHSLYVNIKLIKSRKGWYWKGKVHETLYNDNLSQESEKLKSSVLIYQNRNENCESSLKRLTRDIDVLLQDLKEVDKEENEAYYARILFYLGQTYNCLSSIAEGEKKEEYWKLSLKYFKQRIKVNVHIEELYSSCEMCGDLSILLKEENDTVIGYYLKCLEYQPRAEPLIKISIQYFLNKKFVLSYMFIGFACRLEEPKNVFMYYNPKIYQFTRWYLLAISCLEIGKHNIEIFKAGIDALSIARDCPDKNQSETDDYEQLLSQYKMIAYELKEKYYDKTFDPNYKDPDEVRPDNVIEENGVTTFKIGYPKEE